ncbi:gp345 [Bacillus phage G]|uniref:Gp345 n=1 Tax=Bacillus phage G TaxID=2884420 RepID=G3MA86_9CAUD|nr:gp345 [Bacillus phage G]AEO93604.1 gp345 [Bacillus phage G]
MKRLIKKSKGDSNMIGFIGYSSAQFDEEKAKEIVEEIFKSLNKNDVIVSGATNLGIPKLVYKKANELGMKTVGVMCEEGRSEELADLDELIVEGENWGDESEKFLSMISVLYKIGGGKQSTVEFKKANEMGIKTFEYEL